MTAAEKQAAYRARRAAEVAAGVKVVVKKVKVSPPLPKSLAGQWEATIAHLMELQARYQDWLDAMPEHQQDSPTGEIVAAICDLDLESVAVAPRGFGRD